MQWRYVHKVRFNKAADKNVFTNGGHTHIRGSFPPDQFRRALTGWIRQVFSGCLDTDGSSGSVLTTDLSISNRDGLPLVQLTCVLRHTKLASLYGRECPCDAEG